MWIKMRLILQSAVTEYLRYTTSQRTFESRLTRYKAVLCKEKKRCGIERIESVLSLHSWRTNDLNKYTEYLQAKAEVNRLTLDFYRLQKWRGWMFRLFCKKRSSEHGQDSSPLR